MSDLLLAGTGARGRTATAAVVLAYALSLAGTGTRARTSVATATLVTPDTAVADLVFTVTVRAASAGTPGTPGSPVASTTNRWQLEDPVLGGVYVFPLNPSTADSPLTTRKVVESATTTGQPISHEGSPEAVLWTLTGHLTTEQQLAELTSWAARPYKLWLTDDLERTWVVYLKDWLPVPLVGPDTWRGTYTLRVQLLALT